MALVIGVREGEVFMIGDAKVQVIYNPKKKPDSGHFRVRIDAPQHVRISRPDKPTKSSGDPSDSRYLDPEL